MSRHTKLYRLLCALILVAVCSLTGLAHAVMRVRAGSLTDLPPRPTPAVPPTHAQATSSSSGSSIVLTTAYPTTWDWHTHHWQSLPTQIQWQTASGAWVDVAGWRGAHDEVTVRADGTVTAEKTWWIAPRDYGAGPFRWLVLNETSTVVLGTSTPFNLPLGSGRTTHVEVDLVRP